MTFALNKREVSLAAVKKVDQLHDYIIGGTRGNCSYADGNGSSLFMVVTGVLEEMT
jgi:hypothetical protein